MKQSIAITGATGFVGSRLTEVARSQGREVLQITRSTPGPGQMQWSPSEGTIEAERLRGVDAVVHLAGESLFGLRWTEEKKRRIMKSRVDGTSLIARTLASMQDGPGTLVSASAVGYYGDRAGAVLTESSEPGDDFLASVCVAWEKAADPARAAGIRVVHPRIGIVLHPDGGALAKMLPAFKMGLGGPIGSGEQYFPWITLDDLVMALLFAVDEDSLEGPVNVTAPNPVTNAQFVDELGDALSRPTAIPLPKFAVKLAMGEMGEQTLLSGQRAIPQKLENSTFQFAHRNIGPALEALLAR